MLFPMTPCSKTQKPADKVNSQVHVPIIRGHHNTSISDQKFTSILAAYTHTGNGKTILLFAAFAASLARRIMITV